MRVAVVGTGVLGSSCARGLTMLGASVDAYESPVHGLGTSALGAGVVSELTWDSTNIELIRRSRDLLVAEGLARIVPSVTLVPEPSVGRAQDLARLVAKAGGRASFLRTEDLVTRPPFARLHLEDCAGAIVAESDAVASPPAWAQHALTQAETAGARRRMEAVEKVGLRGLTLEGGRTISYDSIVLAAGVWSRGIAERSGYPLPLVAYRTQAALFAEPASTPEVPIVHDAIQGFYFRPHDEGILAGNGTTLGDHDVVRGPGDADPGFGARQAARLRHRLGSVGRLLDAWAGLETGTPDRQPLAGPDPRCEGLFLLLGGNGFGFMRSPALGEAVANLVLGKRPPVDIEKFAPARFAGRWTKPFAAQEGFTL
ncbi:MAG: NAD(P)/FAD-dependent oxidoreductase [Thermoplasmatota archaeon]